MEDCHIMYPDEGNGSQADADSPVLAALNKTEPNTATFLAFSYTTALNSKLKTTSAAECRVTADVGLRNCLEWNGSTRAVVCAKLPKYCQKYKNSWLALQ